MKKAAAKRAAAKKAAANKKNPVKKPGQKPAVKPSTVQNAEGTDATPIAGSGAVAKVQRPKSNLTPEMEQKLASVVTPDKYLGKDPYKGTKLALSPAQKNLLKKQPRFGLNGFEIDENAAQQLRAIAKILKTRPKIKLEIGGFGCDLGNASVTKQISLGRAESIRQYLLALGIPPEQVKSKAYGNENPIRDNNDPDGKMANRRVQFKFF
jgi:outer membrane protein OmpA-like peptidoglycan-associated protein